MKGLASLLSLFLLLPSSSLPASVTFHNKHSGIVAVYYDRFGQTPTSNGLQFLAELQPSQSTSFETFVSHVFEVKEIDNLYTLDVFQISAEVSELTIYSVRLCTFSDLFLTSSSLLPSHSQCSIAVWRDFVTFQRVALAKHREKQFVDFGEEVEQRRRENEKRRQYLNSVQPGMTPQFTPFGYEIVQLPDDTWLPIKNFWEENKHKMELEIWDDPSNHHINHWEVPSYTLFITPEIERRLRAEVKPILEKWIGGRTPLTYSMTYGIRVYFNNSYLLCHVDRSATHAVSAILQVDQRVDEDWLLEVHGNDGKVNHLKLLPGQLALYESARVIHGREKPLRGDYFANVFIHFRPTHNWNLPEL